MSNVSRTGDCIEGQCPRKRYARGYCTTHYRRHYGIHAGEPRDSAIRDHKMPYDRDYLLSEIEWLRNGRMSPFEISAALGFKPAALERLLQRWGRNDVAGFFHLDAAA